MTEQGLKMNVMDDCYPKEVEAIYRRIAEGMDLPRKRKRHLEAMNHTQLQAHNLKIALSVCCKEMNLDDAVVLYNDAKSRGIHPSSDSYNNLLSLVAGLGEQGSGSYPIREVAPPSDINAAFVVFRDAKDQKIAFSEASYTALIRCCCANNRCQEALNLYEEMIAASLSPRLRTFTPLLASFSLLCDVSTCRRLFDAMTITYSLIPTEREYLSMLRLFLATNDTTQFLSFLSIMAQDIFIPTRETWDVMEKWVQAQNAVTSNYVASHRVVSPTGYISPRGPQLASIDLTPDVRQTTLQQITEIVEQRKTKESAKWTSHITWLQNLAPNAFDVIIDGANVGYYQQNYEGAPKHVDYVQIDTVLRQLQLSGHRPLLILHCRHLFADVVPAQYAALVAAWKQEKVICITPAGFNDDWFWLYSALYLGCDVVTNDEMRDHHFQMLSTRCNVVRYNRCNNMW